MSRRPDEARRVQDSSLPHAWKLQSEESRRYIHHAVRESADLVRSSYGPTGLSRLIDTQDKQNRERLVITEDGAEVLNAIDQGNGFGHPVTALLVDGLEGLRKGLHDGTTRGLLLTEALVTAGVRLLDDGMSEASIVVGFGIAQSLTGHVLDELALPVDISEKRKLVAMSNTIMTSLEPTERIELAPLVVDAVEKIKGESDGWIDTDDIHVIAAPNAPAGVYDGMILTQPEVGDHSGSGVRVPIRDASIAIIDRPVKLEETASVVDEIRYVDPEARLRYLDERDTMVTNIVDNLVDMGIDLLVSTESLNQDIVHAIERRGICIRDKAKYPKEGIPRLAKATGATVVSDIRELHEGHLGRAKNIEQEIWGDEIWTYITGTPGAVVTVVIGGGTSRGAERQETAVANAIETLSVGIMDGQALPGAGAAAMAVATDLRTNAPQIPGREQVAVNAFADAMEVLPTTLAINAGYDPIDTVTALRRRHSADTPQPIGFDPTDGEVQDTITNGIIEPRRTLSRAIDAASTMALRLLMVDEIIHPGVDINKFQPVPERS